MKNIFLWYKAIFYYIIYLIYLKISNLEILKKRNKILKYKNFIPFFMPNLNIKKQ